MDKKAHRRQKKLFAGEKCSICDREANGIKYNAISCDSCRVFFRRVVLSMEKHSQQNTQLICNRDKVSSCTYGLSPRDTMLKCQHCRYDACQKAGMRVEYVQGTKAFSDSRTLRKKKAASSKKPRIRRLSATSVSSNEGREISPVELSTITTQYHSSPLVEVLFDFWNQYVGVNSISNSQEIFGKRPFGPPSPPKMESIIEHHQGVIGLAPRISMLLFSHLKKVMAFVDQLPFMDTVFQNKAQRSRLAMNCFVELIVLRWAATTDETKTMIRGINGANYSISGTVSVGTRWASKFREYFIISQRIRGLGVDNADLSLMTGLVLLTSDRHDDLCQEQRNLISIFQELFATALYQKSVSEGKPRKMSQIMSMLTTMRSTIRSLDLNSITGFEGQRRIMLTEDLTISV